MDRTRKAGAAVMALGGVLLVVGVIGALATDDGDVPGAAPSRTSSSVAPTSSDPTTSTTAVATTRSSTSTSATPTTTAVPTETLDEFVTRFNGSTSSGDLAFLFERLHPVVLRVFDPDTCRAFLAERFDGTTIELVGEPSTSTQQTFQTPDGPVVVENLVSVDVVLTFRGRPVETVSTFTEVDGLIRWFTNCE